MGCSGCVRCCHIFPDPVRHYLCDIFKPKPIEDLTKDSGDQGLKKRLNFVDLTCLGIGCIIGSGIFVLTGQAAGNNAGPAIVISFLVGGVCAGLAALCYSEMACMIPVAGSAYTFTYATMGEFMAWLIGWNLILEYLVGAATVSVGWSSYVVSFIRDVGGGSILYPKIINSPFSWNDTESHFYLTGNYINLPAIAIIVALTSLLIFGIKESATFNTVMVAIKAVVILIFVFASIKWIHPGNWEPFVPKETSFGHYGVSGILQATTLVFFSYVGFDAICTTAQECKRPQRDLPIGIISSLIICTILYIAVCLCLTGLVPYKHLIGQASPISTACEYVGQTWLAIVTEVGAITGTTSVMLVSLMSQPRIFFSMARDGLLPRWLSHTHHRFGTPWVTTTITGTIAAILGGLLPIEILGELTSVGTLCAFFLVSLSVTIMRIREPKLERAFKVPFGPYIIPILSALCAAFVIGWSTTATKIRLLIWMAIGIIIYLAYGKQHSVFQKRLKQRRQERIANMVEYSDSVGSDPRSDLPVKKSGLVNFTQLGDSQRPTISQEILNRAEEVN